MSLVSPIMDISSKGQPSSPLDKPQHSTATASDQTKRSFIRTESTLGETGIYPEEGLQKKQKLSILESIENNNLLSQVHPIATLKLSQQTQTNTSTETVTRSTQTDNTLQSFNIMNELNAMSEKEFECRLIQTMQSSAFLQWTNHLEKLLFASCKRR